MIELYDGQITDLLRNNPLQYDPEVMAMGYAIREEKRRIMAETAQTLTMAILDNAPEFVLDVLAVELRTPAYDETLPVETKRTLIKGTLEFYAHLGTPWAVNWVIRSIFGNGKVTDWYEYGGEAHHFRVSAMNDGTFETLEGLAAFIRMISTIKRLSSWIDGITVDTDMGAQPLRFGGVMAIQTRLPMPEITQITMFGASVELGGRMAITPRIAVPAIPDEITMTHTGRVGLQMTATVTIPLPEIP